MTFKTNIMQPDEPENSAPENCATQNSAGLRLHDLSEGCRAILGEARGLDPTLLRLLEMGMTPGAEVVLTRRAPFGDPLEIAVRGTRLCLRRADAERFPVVLVAPASLLEGGRP